MNGCLSSRQRNCTVARLSASSHALRHDPIGRVRSTAQIVGVHLFPARPTLWKGNRKLSGRALGNNPIHSVRRIHARLESEINRPVPAAESAFT